MTAMIVSGGSPLPDEPGGTLGHAEQPVGVLYRIFESLGDIRGSLANLDAKVDTLDKRMEQFDKRMEQFDTRLNHVERTVDLLDTRVDRLDKRVDRVEDRFSGVEASLQVIRGKVDRVYWTAAVSVGFIGLTSPLLWRGLKAWIALS